MKRTFSLAICLCLVAAGAFAADSGTVARDYSGLQIAVDGPNVIQKSHGQAGFAKAAADTFYMYGGPGTDEGRFQNGILDGPPNAQGWIGVDNSEKAPIWRGSVRSPNASATGDGLAGGFTGALGNAAALAQNDALVPGCDPTYTGYGDGWNMWFVFRYDLLAADPTFDPALDATTVRLTCEFKYDLESCCDFLEFQWNQAGAWNTMLSIAGTTYDSVADEYNIAPLFDSDNYAGGIAYAANEYIDGSNIELRIRVTSDTGWSDQDDLFPTFGRGAAAVDNINVFVNGGLVSTADFEGGTAPDLPPGDFTDLNIGAVSGISAGWTPIPADFVGDFAKIFSNFEATDPCRENTTPQFTFINDGTSPSNCPTCPILPSESSTWTYGIPDGYVLNFTGGLTNGAAPLDNSIWSPPFFYDPNGSVSGVTNGGADFGYTSWRHLPRPNRIYSYWAVRSQPQGSGWSGWQTAPFVYYDGDQAYGNYQHDVTEKLDQAPDSIQIALTVLDLAYIWGIEGDDATPAPTFDNVYFRKFNIGGPVFNTRTIDLASDCFPVDGSTTGTCRFDANIDRDPDVLVPGDSIAVEIVAIIPGTSIVDPPGGAGGLMEFMHLMNPDFAVDRAAGMTDVGAVFDHVDAQTGWDVYSYTVTGQQVVTENGDPISDRFYFDAPDGDSNGLPHITAENGLFFPGDVVHYYMSSTDDAANTSTLPADTTGFGDFAEGNLYNRIYVVRMLPTLNGGTQPNILLWNDNGHRFRENEYLQAFRQNGLIEGSDYDTYTTKGPSSGVGNGLGSAGYHGANAAQLGGYDCMIYVAGDLKSYVISDGSNTGDNDLSPDLATLTDWHNASADRFHAYFGDHIAEAMVSHGTDTGNYMTSVMGVNFLGPDVRPEIEDQVAATVAPTGLNASYVTNYVAYGGCLVINDFDHIEPVDDTIQQGAHEFLDTNGNPYVGLFGPVYASVDWNRLDDTETYTKHTIVFPYDLRDVRGVGSPGVSARATLLGEVFSSWGKNPGGPAIGANKPIAKFAMSQNYPNPFNPKTVIEFAMPARGHVSVKVYNVRGELVTTLQDGVMDSGPQQVIWSGKDSNGMQVSTGVYLYKAQYADTEVVKKMALIK